MLDAAGCESHATDCDVPNITDIFLPFEIPAREVVENHLDAHSVLAVQNDFSVLTDCLHKIKRVLKMIIEDWNSGFFATYQN